MNDDVQDEPDDLDEIKNFDELLQWLDVEEILELDVHDKLKLQHSVLDELLEMLDKELRELEEDDDLLDNLEDWEHEELLKMHEVEVPNVEEVEQETVEKPQEELADELQENEDTKGDVEEEVELELYDWIEERVLELELEKLDS